MTPAQGIAKLGFRRWYERQLIESHVYLVTCILSMMAVAACLELIEWRGPVGNTVLMVLLIVAGAALGFASLRRYNFMLIRAECLGAQSSCVECKTYGVLQVLNAGAADESKSVPSGGDNAWIRVRCKKCGHEWHMENK